MIDIAKPGLAGREGCILISGLLANDRIGGIGLGTFSVWFVEEEGGGDANDAGGAGDTGIGVVDVDVDSDFFGSLEGGCKEKAMYKLATAMR